MNAQLVVMKAALVAMALAVSSVAAAHGRAPAAGQWCFEVKGTIAVSFTAPGSCDSPFGMCTAGVTTGNHGFLDGTTAFSALGLGGGVIGEPSIVYPPVEPASTWTYRGTLVLSTKLGDLVTTDVGVLDTVGGVFTELVRVQSGTGLYVGATGTLYMFGTTYADGSGFGGDVRGQLCLPTGDAERHGEVGVEIEE